MNKNDLEYWEPKNCANWTEKDWETWENDLEQAAESGDDPVAEFIWDMWQSWK